MLIYASHEFGGKPENVERVEKKLIALQEKFGNDFAELGITIISPLHATGYLYHRVKDYEEGMRMCLDLLRPCNAMLVFGDQSNSRGCTLEKKFCQDQRIPVIEYDNFESYIISQKLANPKWLELFI